MDNNLNELIQGVPQPETNQGALYDWSWADEWLSLGLRNFMVFVAFSGDLVRSNMSLLEEMNNSK